MESFVRPVPQLHTYMDAYEYESFAVDNDVTLSSMQPVVEPVVEPLWDPNHTTNPHANSEAENNWINYHIQMPPVASQNEAQYAAECLLQLAGTDLPEDQEIDVVNNDEPIIHNQVHVPLSTPATSPKKKIGKVGRPRRKPNTLPYIRHEVVDPDADQSNSRRGRRSKFFIAGVSSGMISEVDVYAKAQINLTHSELKIYARLGKQPPTHGPLSLHQIEDLKMVRKRIQQQLSAWCGKQKKEDYVKQLERMVRSYDKENARLRKMLESVETKMGIADDSGYVEQVPSTSASVKQDHHGLFD